MEVRGTNGEHEERSRDRQGYLEEGGSRDPEKTPDFWGVPFKMALKMCTTLHTSILAGVGYRV